MIVKYANYDEDGNIISTGMCSPKRFAKKLERNERVILGEADDRLHKVVDGKIVEKDPIDIEEPIPITENTEPLARICEKDWQEVLSRISALEKGD